jgi:putative transposase
MLFWTAADLEAKPFAFKDYYNGHRTHAALNWKTPVEITHARRVDFKTYRWQKHCRGLYQTPFAA